MVSSAIVLIIIIYGTFLTLLGQVSTLAGTTVCINGTIAAGTCNSGSADGVGTNAKFNNPTGVAVNPIGTLLYVTDFRNNNIRTIALPSGK